MLNLDEIKARCRAGHFRGPLLYREETLSTNDDALRLAAEGAAEGTIVIAERQLAGRGRRGRTWLDQPHCSLLFSIVLRPSLPVASWPLLVNAAGVAVAEALTRCAGCPARTRWPNDIVIRGRKVAGLLLEARAPQFAVLGIGVNVLGQREELPAELREVATILAAEAATPVTREQVLGELLDELGSCYDLLLSEGQELLLERHRRLETTLGRPVRALVGEEQIEGLTKDLTIRGGLLLETAEGVREVDAGEITILRETSAEGHN